MKQAFSSMLDQITLLFQFLGQTFLKSTTAFPLLPVTDWIVPWLPSPTFPIDMFKLYPPIPQNVAVFEDKVFTQVIKVK